MIIMCNNCGKEFNAANRKTKFCSQKCYFENRFPGGAKILKCKICGKEYRARGNGKIYCSLRCYINDPEPHKRASEKLKKGEKYNCDYCGNTIILRPCEKNLSRRHFCNSLCYRKYMADRFDRYINSNVKIPLLNNFDEFLMQEILPCPIDGCGWIGKQLTLHMNFEHGIKKEEFKKIAGFNRKTAVVSSLTLNKYIRQGVSNLNSCKFRNGHPQLTPAELVGHTQRPEEKEHRLKNKIFNKITAHGRKEE